MGVVVRLLRASTNENYTIIRGGADRERPCGSRFCRSVRTEQGEWVFKRACLVVKDLGGALVGIIREKTSGPTRIRPGWYSIMKSSSARCSCHVVSRPEHSVRLIISV